MERFIEVYDNVFDLDYQNNIEKFCSELSYKFSTASTEVVPPVYAPIFGYNFFPNRKYSTDYLNSIVYGLSYFIKKPLVEIIQGRAFIQLPNNPMPIHPPHIDFPEPHWVCLYYVNDSDGDTIFYGEDQKTVIKRVSPKKGRIAFFNGSIYHSSSSPTKNHRIIVNINFKSLIHVDAKLNAQHNL